MILCVAAAATQLEMLSPLILGLHVMWKTPWTRSTSSSDDRGFTCQSVFIILPRFVLYSSRFNLRYVKYFPIAACFFSLSLSSSERWERKENMRIAFGRALFESYQPEMRAGVTSWSLPRTSRQTRPDSGKFTYRKRIRTCGRKAESVW